MARKNAAQISIEDRDNRDYNQAREDLARLLDYLKQEFERHSAFVAQRGMKAGQAAPQLATVREFLIISLAKLAKRDRRYIENALANKDASFSVPSRRPGVDPQGRCRDPQPGSARYRKRPYQK